MRTANNNYTVENLVAKYRNYVKEHCPKICEECGLVPVRPDGNADEQLLVTLYNSVAGKKADHQIISALAKYAEKYKQAALEKEEYAYLCENFKEFVSYEFAHRSEWAGGFIVGGSVPSQFLEIIREMATPENGQTVFVADAGLGDVAMLFPDCVVKGFTGYCGSTIMYDEVWALGQIRLYAAGIKSEIVPGIFDESKEKYMYTLPDEDSADVVIHGTTWDSECEDIHQLYRLLRPNGTMFLFSDKKRMAGDGEEKSLREQLVCEKAIHLLGSFEGDFIGMATDVILAYIRKTVNETVEIVNGKRGISTIVKSEELDSEILWPSYYLASRPSEGKPLSSIAELASNERLAKFIKGKGYVLPEEAKDMLLVLPNALGESYKDANLWHKSVSNVSDPALKEEDWIWFRVAKEPCVLINGSTEKLLVGYTTKVPPKGFAYMAGCCIVPKEGIDVRYLAALLFDPIVKEQILTICDGNVSQRLLSLVLDKIIVPSHDEMERLNFLAEANYDALVSSQEELKQEANNYKKAVRMRKHALTQSLSSIESMFYALNTYRLRQNGTISDTGVISRIKGTTVREAFEFLSKNIEDMMPALEHIAEIDYSFNQPEWIDPEKFIEGYITKHENGWLNFKPVLTWENGHNLAKKELKDPFSGEIILKEGDALNLFSFPKDALNRIFDNVISNAQAYGFTTPERKDYQLRFSWHTDGIALIIEIENNGTPIPADREASSLLEYGVSTALHQAGHNGIGCNEIYDIMQRYDGHVEIVSSPDKDFTVKYVLTFNRTNTIGSYNL